MQSIKKFKKVTGFFVTVLKPNINFLNFSKFQNVYNQKSFYHYRITLKTVVNLKINFLTFLKLYIKRQNLNAKAKKLKKIIATV